MRLLKYGSNLDGELLTTTLFAALVETKSRLAEVIVLLINRTAMRADGRDRPKHAFEVREGGGFIVKVGLAENGHGINLQCRQPSRGCRGL